MSALALSFEGPLAHLRLQRAHKRNAISQAMWRDIAARCDEIAASREALCVILAGEGEDFSAGADIDEFDAVYADADKAEEYIQAIQAALNAVTALDRPTIALLKGVAMGGGLALAMACDLRFCAADAQLAITPAKLGLLYGHAETRRLVELVGPSRAKDFLFSARKIAPQEALSVGLVDRLCIAGEVEHEARAYALHLSNLSQRSIRGAKRAVDAIVAGLVVEDGQFRAAVVDAATGADALEGRAAFAGKRKAQFGWRG